MSIRTDKKILRIGGRPVGDYSIYMPEIDETLLHAAHELSRYVYEALGALLGISDKRGETQITLETDASISPDGFSVCCKDGGLRITGGGSRGVLYGVYAFLEKFVGWRFFAGEMCIKGTETGAYIAPVEKLLQPETDEIPDGYVFSSEPTLRFRDMFGHACVDEDWCAKNRINGDVWRLKNMPKRYGGSERFAADGGHTFYRLVPTERYFAAHPEYYALLYGVRTPGENSQLCLTADGLAETVAANALELLRQNPSARYISVSQNDNDNFCTCERCRNVERKIGRGNVLINFINKVAAIVGKERPDVKIHTYAYESTVCDDPAPFEKNVSVQYCLRCCRAHALDDSACEINVGEVAKLKKFARQAGELFVYDYRSCEMQTFLPMPDLGFLRRNMRTLADCGVRGLYAETDIFCANSPCAEELRAYVTAKLMWNPYMEEAEYFRHVAEFLQGYYGAGWRHIGKYLAIWERETRHIHLDSVSGAALIDGEPVKCGLIRPERLLSACAEMESALDTAFAQASETEKPRIDMLRVAPLWYRLYHTIENVMQYGDESAKEQVIADNRKLCSLMRRYDMKYTVFIGMTETTEMFRDFTLPPSKWKYWGAGEPINIFSQFGRK